MQITINIDSPWPGWWSATLDEFDGTRCEHDPSKEDRRIATSTDKWAAIRDLIDTLEDIEETRKAKVTG